MVFLGVVLFCFVLCILLDVLWAFWIGSLVSVIFGKFPTIIISLFLLLLSLFLLLCQLNLYYTFEIFSPFLALYFLFFHLCIMVWGVSIDKFSNVLILSLVMSCLLMRHKRHSSFLLLCFWVLAFPFDSFLEFPSLCLY